MNTYRFPKLKFWGSVTIFALVGCGTSWAKEGRKETLWDRIKRPGSFSVPSTVRLPAYTRAQLPRYNQLKRLPPVAQAQVIRAWREFLLRLDDSTRKKLENHAALWLLDFWLQQAEAGSPPQPYCINQGVVKPIDQCNWPALGQRMHDFDTNELLSKLGPASQCPAREKPCAPAFGFTADGQLFCSSKNLTRDCAQKSQAPGTISLASVLLKCEAGSPVVAKIDCRALGEFYDQQVQLVNQLCVNVPDRFACSILAEQMHNVHNEYQAGKNVGTATGADGAGSGDVSGAAGTPSAVPDQVNATNAAVANIGARQGCPGDPVTPANPQDGSPGVVSGTAPLAASDPVIIPANCVKKTVPANVTPLTIANIAGQLSANDQNAACVQLDLPDQRKFAVDLAGSRIIVQGGANSTPILISDMDASVLNTVSSLLVSNNVPADQLLANYFPNETFNDHSKIKIKATSQNPEREFEPTAGWISSNGMKIRYAIETRDGKQWLHLSLQPPGAAEPLIVSPSQPIPTQSQDSQQSQQPQQPQQPPGPQRPQPPQ